MATHARTRHSLRLIVPLLATLCLLATPLTGTAVANHDDLSSDGTVYLGEDGDESFCRDFSFDYDIGQSDSGKVCSDQQGDVQNVTPDKVAGLHAAELHLSCSTDYTSNPTIDAAGGGTLTVIQWSITRTGQGADKTCGSPTATAEVQCPPEGDRGVLVTIDYLGGDQDVTVTVTVSDNDDFSQDVTIGPDETETVLVPAAEDETLTVTVTREIEGNDHAIFEGPFTVGCVDDGEPELTFDKEALDGEDVVETVGVGGSFEYVLTVNNDGDASAINVEISDTIPDALAIVGEPAFDGPEGGSCETEGQEITCTVGDLDADESAFVTVTVQVPEVDADCGEVTNIGQLTHDGLEEPLTASSTVEVDGCAPEIELDKEAQIEPDEDGLQVVMIINGSTGVVTYEYVITNTGNESLSGLTLDDDVLGELDVEVPGGTLAPGESTTVVADYTVTDEDLNGNGSIVNVAVAAGTSDEGVTVDDEDDETVHITEVAGTVIEKPDDPAPAPDPDPAPEPETEVLGTQLAKTGAFPMTSLAVSMLLMALGTGLLAYARRIEPLYRRR